jgi:hypothetical protein
MRLPPSVVPEVDLFVVEDLVVAEERARLCEIGSSLVTLAENGVP